MRGRKGKVMSLRPIKQILQTKPTLEGAGVKLQRAFGFGKTKDFDPFPLLDDFRNDNPEDYLAGFPWHPHRGLTNLRVAIEIVHDARIRNVRIVQRPQDRKLVSGFIHSLSPHAGQLQVIEKKRASL
jgi:hypothetical protein